MSKEISLTQGKVAIVDDADYDYLNQWKWFVQRDRATWYAMRNAYKDGKRTTIRMHREILEPPADMETDHIDHDGLNNRGSNLRVATNTQNQHNQRKRKGTSQFKGVCWHRRRKKWHAQIQVERRNISLGYFLFEIEAARVYDKVAKKYFGEFACTNF